MDKQKGVSLKKRSLRLGIIASAFTTSALWVCTDNFGINDDDEKNLKSDDNESSYVTKSSSDNNPDNSFIIDISVPMLLSLAYLAIRSRERNKNLAYHEAGHALSLIYNKPGLYLEKIHIRKNLIFPEGANELRLLKPEITYEDAQKLISGLLSGNIAERIGCGDYLCGFDADDNAEALKIAKQMLEAKNTDPDNMSLLSHIASTALHWLHHQRNITQILSEQKEEAYDFLITHEDELHILAQALLEHESMSREEVFKVLNLQDTEKDIQYSPENANL